MDLRESILSQTDVSLSLAKHVIATEAKNSNFVFSPLSIHVVLGMITAGSAGATRDQMLGFLRARSAEELNSLSSHFATLLFVDGAPLGGPCLNFANGLWLDQRLGLKPTFKEIVDGSYRAACGSADFMNKADEVRKEVNAWADRETNGLIKEILPPYSVDSYTKLIFANAVYFKGAWDQKFSTFLTNNCKFFLLDGTSIQAPFMRSWEKQYVSAFDGFKVLQLPYNQGEDKKRRFSMYFFLPNAKDGLPSLLEQMSSSSGFIERHMPHKKVTVGEFLIPKFKIDFGFEASKVLKGVGVVLPFDIGGLTEMVDSSRVSQLLCVSKILHKSFIEVNEEGTEAAAATASVVTFGCSPTYVEDKVDFVADHPFMLVIREDMTGAVLFVGQVVNPLAG